MTTMVKLLCLTIIFLMSLMTKDVLCKEIDDCHLALLQEQRHRQRQLDVFHGNSEACGLTILQEPTDRPGFTSRMEIDTKTLSRHGDLCIVNNDKPVPRLSFISFSYDCRDYYLFALANETVFVCLDRSLPRPKGLDLVQSGVNSSGGFEFVSYEGLGFISSGVACLLHPEDTELETLIAISDIPLDLRPRMPDPNFRMINLPDGDTAIGIYSRIFDSSGVRIPFSSFLLAVLKYFKAHIVKLHDIPEGVLVRYGLSRVWRNPVCDPVLRCSDNTVMSIYDFLCMPSLHNVTIREEPHELGTSILGIVVDRTTSPAPVGTAIPRASLEEIAVTRPDPKRDGLEFALESNESLTDVSPDKEVEHYQELSEASGGLLGPVFTHLMEAMPTPDTQPLDADAGSDEIASDGNVDLYYEARVSNIAGDVLEIDLIPFVLGLYYIPYPYDEGSGKLYKDPKVCKTALDRFPTPVETHRLRELSSVELSDQMSVLQCQLITHESMLNARYDYSLRNVERLAKRCAQQTQTIKKQGADLKQQKESTVRANEEVSSLTTELRVLKSMCQTVEHKLSSWDKKHKKYRNERDTLSTKKAKIKEELVGTTSQLEHRERQAEEIQGSIASFFQSDFTPLKVVGFIPDAKEKFDRAKAAFPDTTFPFLDKVSQHSQSSLPDLARLEPDRVTSSHQTSSVAPSLRANTHIQHSTSSSGAFGHTSTLEHLKKKKKSIEKGGPSAA
ncbi:hypothetical protein Tco_0272869 [Tanacetum coccineum]